jgi:hypothetical protein
VPPQIEPYDPPPGREVGELVVPAMPVGRPAVDEHERYAVSVAGPLVVVHEYCAVDFELRHGGLLRAPGGVRGSGLVATTDVIPILP